MYKGVLDLLKYIIQPIETALHANIDTPVLSLFLVLRLALCLCSTPSRKKKLADNTEPTDVATRSSPLPSLKLANHLTNSLSGQYECEPATPLLPAEIEMKVLSDERVSSDCRRVRIHEPVSKEGIDKEGELRYLHTDLLKGFSNVMKDVIIKRHFWNNLFSAVVQADRKYLGWNEKTGELYER